MEYRSITDQLNGQVKDLDAKRHEVQVIFPHSVTDSYRTQFSPDCFRECFASGRRIAMCWQHKMDEVIGRVVDKQITSKGNELRAAFSDLDAVPMAKRAFVQLQSGDLNDFSFAFARSKDRPHPSLKGVTEITSATMSEISPVTQGAIPGAGMVSVRHQAPILDRVPLSRGARVAAARTMMGVTVEQMAEALEEPVMLLRAWESGKVPMTSEDAFHYESFFRQFADEEDEADPDVLGIFAIFAKHDAA